MTGMWGRGTYIVLALINKLLPQSRRLVQDQLKTLRRFAVMKKTDEWSRVGLCGNESK